MRRAKKDDVCRVQCCLVRTDLSKSDPFCPSTPFMKRSIEMMHRHGVTVNTVTWTSGDNRDVYRKLRDVGFDHFTTDYPYVRFDVVDEIHNRSK